MHKAALAACLLFISAPCAMAQTNAVPLQANAPPPPVNQGPPHLGGGLASVQNGGQNSGQNSGLGGKQGGGEFAKIDTNGDGFVDRAEFTAMIEKRAQAMFAKIDANGDGKISPEEMQAWREQHKGGPGGGPPGEARGITGNDGKPGAPPPLKANPKDDNRFP